MLSADQWESSGSWSPDLVASGNTEWFRNVIASVFYQEKICLAGFCSGAWRRVSGISRTDGRRLWFWKFRQWNDRCRSRGAGRTYIQREPICDWPGDVVHFLWSRWEGPGFYPYSSTEILEWIGIYLVHSHWLELWKDGYHDPLSYDRSDFQSPDHVRYSWNNVWSRSRQWISVSGRIIWGYPGIMAVYPVFWNPQACSRWKCSVRRSPTVYFSGYPGEDGSGTGQLLCGSWRWELRWNRRVSGFSDLSSWRGLENEL